MYALAHPPWSTMLASVADADPPDALELERLVVQRAQGGDRAAMGQLLVSHGPALYRRVLLPRLGSDAAAKDALAETYAKAVARIDQFVWQGAGIYPWLRVVALRVALDMLRARRRVLLWEPDHVEREIDRAESDAPTDQLHLALSDEREARAKVTAALALIHARYAEAIRMRLLEERSREDTARLLGVTPATFDVLLHRAIAALKKRLQASDAPTAEHDRP